MKKTLTASSPGGGQLACPDQLPTPISVPSLDPMDTNAMLVRCFNILRNIEYYSPANMAKPLLMEVRTVRNALKRTLNVTKIEDQSVVTQMQYDSWPSKESHYMNLTSEFPISSSKSANDLSAMPKPSHYMEMKTLDYDSSKESHYTAMNDLDKNPIKPSHYTAMNELDNGPIEPSHYMPMGELDNKDQNPVPSHYKSMEDLEVSKESHYYSMDDIFTNASHYSAMGKSSPAVPNCASKQRSSAVLNSTYHSPTSQDIFVSPSKNLAPHLHVLMYRIKPEPHEFDYLSIPKPGAVVLLIDSKTYQSKQLSIALWNGKIGFVPSAYLTPLMQKN